MKEHEHPTINKPETKPAHDEVAKKAYGIYLKEGRPQGRDVQNWLGVESKMPRAGPEHHGRMAANDAPALAQADLGIAIGTGSDVAVETAEDFFGAEQSVGCRGHRARTKNLRSRAQVFGLTI